MIYNSKELDTRDTFDLLDDFGYLTESDIYFPASMVNVKYSSRLDQNMIQLESMVDYALANGISNASIAMQNICEANHVDESILSVCVNEDSIYADEEMADTVRCMKEAGYKVNIMPILSTSVYYTKLQEALELDEGYDFESSEHLQYYLNENILEDIRDKAVSVGKSIKNHVSRNVDNMKSAYKSVKNHVSGKIDQYKNTTKNNIENLKGKYQDTKSNIAKKYASLKKTISEKYAAAKKATGEAKVALLKQIDKLKSAAASLKSKLPLVGK